MSKYIETLKEKRQIALNEIVKCDLVLSEYSSERTTSDCIVRKIRLKGKVEAYDEAIAAYESSKSEGETE